MRIIFPAAIIALLVAGLVTMAPLVFASLGIAIVCEAVLEFKSPSPPIFRTRSVIAHEEKMNREMAELRAKIAEISKEQTHIMSFLGKGRI